MFLMIYLAIENESVVSRLLEESKGGLELVSQVQRFPGLTWAPGSHHLHSRSTAKHGRAERMIRIHVICSGSEHRLSVRIQIH
jgi:hypothetical protein